MSTAKSPLQDKRPNKNAIIGIITSSLKREESTKKSDRILKHLLPNAPNALRGQRSYSTKAKPVLVWCQRR
jgi:hypothetical protein